TGLIADPTNYSAATGLVYVQVTSASGCVATAQIQLTAVAAPNINTTAYNTSICDNDLDGIVSVTFSDVTPLIVNNAGQFNVRYYLNQADAIAGNNNTLGNTWTYSTPTTVYVRVDALNGNCAPALDQLNFTVGPKVPVLTTNHTATLCDPDGNGWEQANLNNYTSAFTADPAATF